MSSGDAVGSCRDMAVPSFAEIYAGRNFLGVGGGEEPDVDVHRSDASGRDGRSRLGGRGAGVLMARASTS